MDRLRKIIDALNGKFISPKKAKNRLKTLDYSDNIDQLRHNKIILNKLINEYVYDPIKTPEELVIEAENARETVELLAEVRGILSEIEWDILYRTAVTNATQEEVAQIRKISQPRVKFLLSRAQSKIPEALKQKYYGLFHAPQSTLEAHSPESVGYPFEFLQNVGQKPEWKKKNGKRHYTLRSVCKVPEYVNAKCSWCWEQFGNTKCTRLDVN